MALMSSGSFETFAVVCSKICPREVDIPGVQCEQPRLHFIVDLEWTQRHVNTNQSEKDLNQSLPSMSSVASC